MKILAIIHSLDGGGAERVMAGLASRLGRRGHQLVLATLDDGSSDRHEVDPGVRRIYLDMMGVSHNLWQRLTNNRSRIRAVEAVIKNERPDAVVSFCDRTNVTVLLASARLNVPVVISERSDPGKQKLGFMWEAARRRAYPKARRIIALTETSAQHLQPLSSNPVVVIPSAVELPPEQSDRERAQQNKRLLGIGRLEYEKGFDRLIEAFAMATEDHTQWSLRILGEGSLREELEQMGRTLEIAERLTLPGWVDSVWPEISNATLFALPSRYEGFPSALLEAMATGVPCVSVDCESGPREIISHERNGLLVRNSVKELAEGIRRLIEDADLRERIGHAATDVSEQYDWDKMVDAYEDVLRSVVSQD